MSAVSSDTERAAALPAAMGYRWPAEWERHAATWLSWPKNPTTWPGRLGAVEAAYVEIVRALAPGERVRINVDDEATAERVRGLLAQGGVTPLAQVELFCIETDDAWLRDNGPLFLLNDESGERALLDCGFNAWGGKYPPWERDELVPRKVAEALGVRRFEVPLVLEGGSIEGDGAGTLLTTESCLQNPNRGEAGRARSRESLERALAGLLGARRVLWLGDGIEGDDTDGHVDDLTRFVSRDVLLTAVEPNASDPNHAVLEANLRRLRAMRDAAGKPYRLVELPMPPPLRLGADRLPASHANFYIGNEVVLLPGFGAASDARAAAILAECLPARDVVVIPSADLVVGLGSVHCLTQQEPASP